MSGSATDSYTWIGSQDAAWGSASDWADVSTGTKPASSAPGAQTPVSIRNTAKAGYAFITGGGTAASLGLLGNVALIGTYGIAGSMTVGSLTPAATPVFTAGVLTAAPGTTISAGALAVIDGVVDLAQNSFLAVSGGVALGHPSGWNVLNNGTYVPTRGAAGEISLSAGAALSIGGGFSAQSGGLTDTGGQVTIGGSATIGVAGTVISTSPSHTMNATYADLVVLNGGTVSVAGAIAAPDGQLVAEGAGSTLIVGGTVTTGTGGTWDSPGGRPAPTSGVLLSLNGGFVRLGGLVLAPTASVPFADRGVVVDSTSTIEIGTAGGAAAGAITIDSGQTVIAATTGSISGNVVANGTLLVNGGTLTVAGNVSGTGAVRIAANATLQLNGTIGATDTIQFGGGHAALAVGAVPGTTQPYGVAAMLTGFVSGDTILVPNAITSLSYTSGTGGNPGTLTVNGAGGTQEVLRIASIPAGTAFSAHPVSGGYSAITLVSTTATSAASTNADTYVWNNINGGTWGTTADWTDQTAANAAPTTVPGTLTSVVISSSVGTMLVQGNGSAASLSLSGNIALAGSHVVGGAVNVGSVVAGVPPGATRGTLTVLSQATVTAGTLAVTDGALTLATGAALAVSGGISAGFAGGYDIPSNGTFAYTAGASGSVTVAAGATLTAGGPLALAAGVLADAGGRVTAGSLSVGTAATIVSTSPAQTRNAAFAEVIVTAGGSLAVSGSITAPDAMLVADGTGSRLVAGGTLTTGAGGSYSYHDALGFPQIFDGALIAVNGGFVQLGGLVLAPTAGAPAGETGVFVDAASTIEVGTANDGSAGALTIDTGRTVTAGFGAAIDANLVNNGTFIVSAGTVLQSGQVSGAGIIDISGNACWVLDGGIASTETIGLLGAGAELLIGGQFSFTGSNYATAAYNLNAVVTGFQPGEAIALLDPATSVTYTAGQAANTGTLTLSNQGTPVEVIDLLGNFSGDQFVLSQTPAGGAVVSVVAPAAAGTRSTNADAYVRTAASGGSWASAANWQDTTTATGAIAAPGSLTGAALHGATGAAMLLTGGGVAQNLGVTGTVALNGSYAIGGTLTVGAETVAPAVTLTAGSLALTSGGVITAGTIAVTAGVLSLDAGATITVGHGVSLGTPAGRNVPVGTSFAANPGAAGTIDVGMGATLGAAGGITVASGSLCVADGVVTAGGGLSIGTAAAGTAATASSTVAASGAVIVAGGGLLSVSGGVTDTQGVLAVDGIGSTLVAAGTFTAAGGGSYVASTTSGPSAEQASLLAVNGGFVRVGSVTLTASTVTSLGLLADGQSVLEVGTAGGAASGAITVDPGFAITSAGTACLSGSLVNNGTVLITGGTLVENGNVSGTGMIEIGTGATWVVEDGVSAGPTIAFTGSGGVLAIGSGASVGATITGFQLGDILLTSQPVTTATFTAGIGSNPGKLVLSNAAGTVAVLSLAGSYAGKTFTVTPDQAGSAVSLANYQAIPTIEDLYGAALTQTGSVVTLNLGQVVQGAPAQTAMLAIANLGTGAAAVLNASFSVSGSGAFGNTGFAAGVSNLAGGAIEHGQTIALSTANAGVFTEMIVMTPTSTVGAANTVLQRETIVVTGTVLASGSTHTLGATPVSITGGAGNDVFITTGSALQAGDQIDGGGGTNVLSLVGGGLFNLALPAVLTNIQVVDANEANNPTIIMRGGVSETLDLAPALSGSGSALIYGGSGHDVFNLANGHETVVLGSSSDIVHAGGGTAVVKAAIGFAGATVMGGPVGSTTLEITSGGTATLSASDTNLTVKLDARAHLALGGAQFITATGSGGADTIIAGAANQTLTGGGGGDTLVGFSGFGDQFVDTAGDFNGDTIADFGGSDLIDLTDLSFGLLRTPSLLQAGGVSTLQLTDGTHSAAIAFQGNYSIGEFGYASDGAAGVMIRFV